MSQAQQATLQDQLSPAQLALLQKAEETQKLESHPQKENDEPVLYVQDRAASIPRVHDFIDGEGHIKSYRFEDQASWVEVPYSAAIRLVTNDSFVVKDAENNVLRATERHGDAGAPLKLLNTQCVCTFEELMHEALVERASKLGLKCNRKTLKTDLVAFLIEKNREIEEVDGYGIDDVGIEDTNEVNV